MMMESGGGSGDCRSSFYLVLGYHEDNDGDTLLQAKGMRYTLGELPLVLLFGMFGWKVAELEGQSIRLLYPGQTDFEVIGARARRAGALRLWRRRSRKRPLAEWPVLSALHRLLVPALRRTAWISTPWALRRIRRPRSTALP